jgi:dephospho-CoA kinase
MKKVIGLSGKIGAGKGTVSAYLNTKFGASEHRFSDVLIDILKRLHIPPERESLQKLGASLRSQLGQEVLINALEKDLSNSSSDILTVDGIRYPNEVEMLRKFDNSILIFVSAPAKVRFERVKKRGEKGEESINFEEFMSAENRETERHLDSLEGMADYIIDNNGTLNELYANVDKIF